MSGPLLLFAIIVVLLCLGLGFGWAFVSETFKSAYRNGQEAAQKFRTTPWSDHPERIWVELVIALIAGIGGCVITSVILGQVALVSFFGGAIVSFLFLRFRRQIWILWLGFRGNKLHAKSGIDRFVRDTLCW